MTDEERQKLCEGLRVCREPIASHCEKAADEIERLAASVNALEHIINLDMYEVTKTALVQAQDEIERLAALIDDYKLIFGDIHKTELEEMKSRVEESGVL
jgi:hypothetical protein